MRKRIDDPPAQHDVLVQLLAAQVEEAVFEPRVLGIWLVAEHRHRQVAGRAENLDLAHIDFDEAGRHVRVLGAGRALAHLAVDPDDEFRAQLLGLPEGRRIRIDHALGDAVMVAQVDEQHAAVVADAMAPAGQPDRLAVLGEAEGAAGVRAIAMHGNVRLFVRDRARGALPSGKSGGGEGGKAAVAGHSAGRDPSERPRESGRRQFEFRVSTRCCRYRYGRSAPGADRP